MSTTSRLQTALTRPPTRTDYGGFLNIHRSKKLVRDVWARNQEGRVFVDWIDIVQTELDWEIFVV